MTDVQTYPSTGRVPPSTLIEALNAPGFGQAVEIIREFEPNWQKTGPVLYRYKLKVVRQIEDVFYVDAPDAKTAETMFETYDLESVGDDYENTEIFVTASDSDGEPDAVWTPDEESQS